MVGIYIGANTFRIQLVPLKEITFKECFNSRVQVEIEGVNLNFKGFVITVGGYNLPSSSQPVEMFGNHCFFHDHEHFPGFGKLPVDQCLLYDLLYSAFLLQEV